MVLSSQTHRSPVHRFGGRCGMEIGVLLLLTVPLTAALPLRLTPRTDADVVLSGTVVQAADDMLQEQRAPSVRIIPFNSEGKLTHLDALQQSMAGKLRPRRAPQRGCQLGTCQLHNLVNTLYHISKTSGKDESKKAKDPQGYGR